MSVFRSSPSRQRPPRVSFIVRRRRAMAVAIAEGDTLTLAWDGQPVGLIRVTECRFQPPQNVYPAAWLVEGTFTPHPAFDDCRAFFEERVRLEQEYDEAEPGDALATA